MAFQLFANFEHTGTGNNNIFYRPTSFEPFQCVLRMLEENASYDEQLNLSNSFYAEYSLDYGQTRSTFDLLTGVELFLPSYVPAVYGMTVYLYALDDYDLIEPIDTFTLSAAFVSEFPKADFIAYPGLVLNEDTGNILQLTENNYKESRGVYFYGEGHTEVIYLSANLHANATILPGVGYDPASAKATWFIGNELTDTLVSKHKVYDTPNSSISKVILKTTSSQDETLPITLCITNEQMPLVPSSHYYDDFLGTMKPYSFFASSLDFATGQAPLSTNNLKQSIHIRPYPELNNIEFFNPFPASIFSLPYDYKNATFVSRVSALPVPVFYSELTGTTWSVSMDQDSFTSAGSWSTQTVTLPYMNAYQFHIGYDQIYSEFPSLFKASPINDSLLTMQVSCHEQIGLLLPPYDWITRSKVTIFRDQALAVALPSVKILAPNYYNLLDQKTTVDGVEVLGTKFLIDVTNINKAFEILEIQIQSTNYPDTISLTKEQISKPFYINFTAIGTQTLTATTILNFTQDVYEPISIVNIFPDLTESLLEFDNTNKGSEFYKSTLTEFNLPISSAPLLVPNEWAVEDNINHSIRSLYDCIDEVKKNLFLYKPSSRFYGWLGNNKYTWSDLECGKDSEAKLSWEENSCPATFDKQKYVIETNPFVPKCPTITKDDIVTYKHNAVCESLSYSGGYARSFGYGINAYYYTRLDSKYIAVGPGAWVIPQKRRTRNWEFFEIVSVTQWKQIGQHSSQCPLILPRTGWVDVTPIKNSLSIKFEFPRYVQEGYTLVLRCQPTVLSQQLDPFNFNAQGLQKFLE